MTDRRFITRVAWIIIIAATILTATIFVSAATPTLEEKSEMIISEKLREIGVEDGTVAGFYLWSFDKILGCMGDMDTAMTNATEKEHNMAGIFQEAIDSTFEEFAGIQTDEEALEKYNEIINGKETNYDFDWQDDYEDHH